LKDVFNQTGPPQLREVSGKKDDILSMLLEQLRSELTARHRPSPLFVQSIAQSLAIHLVRTYTDPNAKGRDQRGGLPAFKLRRVTELLEAHLDEEFSLDRLAREIGISAFHFCRLFKKTTGSCEKLQRASSKSVSMWAIQVQATSRKSFGAKSGSHPVSIAGNSDADISPAA
jgi:hypothetical protein